MTDRLLARLAERHDSGGIIVVIGPSGSGKSSLLGAGLIGQLDRGTGAGACSKWVPPLLLPPGQHPLQTLAAELAARTKTEDPDDFHQALRSDPVCCATLVRRVCGATGAVEGTEDNEDRRLVLVVDQFEQVFGPDMDKTERSAFIAALDAPGSRQAVGETDGPACPPAALVVLGLRSDWPITKFTADRSLTDLPASTTSRHDQTQAPLTCWSAQNPIFEPHKVYVEDTTTIFP